MAPALVGSAGAVAAGTTAAAPSWDAGAARTAHNLLVCILWWKSAAAVVVAPPAGWSKVPFTNYDAALYGDTGGAVFYKEAAGGDAAPSWSGLATTYTRCQLLEFSGVAVVPDQYGSASVAGATKTLTAAEAGADTAPRDLVIYIAGQNAQYAAADTGGGVTLNNGATAIGTGDNLTQNVVYHYALGYGITTGNGAANQAAANFPGWSNNAILVQVVSFRAAYVAHTFSATQGQSPSRGASKARTFAASYFGAELPMASSLWRLGEASGSLLDSAGGRTGTPHGTVNRVAGLVPGDGDGAVSFPSGSGNYIDTGSAYSTLFSGTGPFSLVAVVQPSFLDGNNRRIMSMMTASSRGLVMYASNGYCGFIRGDAVSSENQYKAIALPLTSPTHIVCTYDGTTMRVYFNGVQAGTGKASSRSLATLNPLYIGNDPYAPADATLQWQGVIDEAMACTYALSQAQITALYTAYQSSQAVTRKASAARTAPVTQSQALTKLTLRPLVASQAQSAGKSMSLSRVFQPTYVPLLKQLADGSVWSLDETVSTYADQVGAVSGTAQGAPTRGAAGLLPGGGGDPADRAAQLVNTWDYVDFGLNYGFAGNAPFSFVLAFKPSVVDATFRRVVTAEATYNRGWALVSTDGVLKFLRGNVAGNDGPSTVPLTAGQLYFIVGTYDGTKMGLYVNGVLARGNLGDPGYYVPSSRALPAQTQPLVLGNTVYSIASGPQPGTYDYFAICKYALSAAQVSALWGAFNQGQAALATRQDSIPAFRTAATQAQAAALAAALGRTVSAAGGQSVSYAAQAAAHMAVTQSTTAAVQRTVSRAFATSAAAAVTMQAGGGPRVTAFALTQGELVTRRGAIAATRPLSQGQAASKPTALNVLLAQLASVRTQRSISRWLARTQTQTPLRRTTQATTLAISQLQTVSWVGVRGCIRSASQAAQARIGRQAARQLTVPQASFVARIRLLAHSSSISQGAVAGRQARASRTMALPQSSTVTRAAVLVRSFQAGQSVQAPIDRLVTRGFAVVQGQKLRAALPTINLPPGVVTLHSSRSTNTSTSSFPSVVVSVYDESAVKLTVDAEGAVAPAAHS